MNNKYKIVLIGAGNVASHLFRAFARVCDVAQVWSRDINHAIDLTSTSSSSMPISDLSDVVSDADFYIISVPDNAIAQVVNALPKSLKGVVAHTSGSIGIEALSAFENHGVFYPLQTFSKSKVIDFSDIPFFIEGSNSGATACLQNLASLLSNKVLLADSSQRASLHIAAVFACNFANHLWSISADILKQAGYDFSIFKPLLTETINKAFEIGPAKAQTGPARRNDLNVINSHLQKLSGDKHDIYDLITKMILTQNYE
jgi:predicted short-subunit dehydrogenase-like oxidoreductase (DUF2520 family)